MQDTFLKIIFTQLLLLLYDFLAGKNEAHSFIHSFIYNYKKRHEFNFSRFISLFLFPGKKRFYSHNKNIFFSITK
jgi:hypothetical protein